MDVTRHSPLLKLSTEIIQEIIDYVDFASHFDFACTCKRIFSCSLNVLQRHRDAHIKYCIISDLDPLTVPTLLRSAFGLDDPLPAWHVRSFEIWSPRIAWDCWKPHPFFQTGGNEEDALSVWNYTSEEMALYTAYFMLNGQEGDASDESHEEPRKALELGRDEPLKALLIAQCPRIRDLKVVEQIRLVAFLSDFLNKGAVSTQGLQSLRSVAFGVPSGTWLDEEVIQSYRSARSFAHLLRLPNIEYIYFDQLRWIDEEEEEEVLIDWGDRLPPQSSSIQHIFLDSCNYVPKEFIDALTATPRELKRLSFRCRSRTVQRLENTDRIVSKLGEYNHSKSTMESLMFYNCCTANISGFLKGHRCTVYLPHELYLYDSLKDVQISCNDMAQAASHRWEDRKDKSQPKMSFWREYIAEWLPTTTQAFILWGGCYRWRWEGYFEDGQDYVTWVEDMVLALLTWRKKYTDLKAIFLEDVERAALLSRSGDPPFQKAVRLGKKFGVDVHTLTNRTKFQHEHHFPRAPDQYDLVTGSFGGKRPDNWVFDVYQGKTVPPGCAKCGNCEDCLELYPKRVWDSIGMEDDIEDDEFE